MNIDEWFGNVRRKYSEQMQYGKGCTACCYGLFDITLSDAVNVARGFAGLPEDLKERVYSRAAGLHHKLRETVPDLPEPTILHEDDPRLDQIIDAVDIAPCPCLGDAGECLIYENRPLACRLEGVPMVDVHEGLFGDWCELNFKEGIPENALSDLEQDYNHIDQLQETRSAGVAQRAGLSDQRAVTFIPSVIAEYESFWKRASGEK
jgi:Fe-S-cluster containining protein